MPSSLSAVLLVLSFIVPLSAAAQTIAGSVGTVSVSGAVPVQIGVSYLAGTGPAALGAPSLSLTLPAASLPTLLPVIAPAARPAPRAAAAQLREFGTALAAPSGQDQSPARVFALSRQAFDRGAVAPAETFDAVAAADRSIASGGLQRYQARRADDDPLAGYAGQPKAPSLGAVQQEVQALLTRLTGVNTAWWRSKEKISEDLLGRVREMRNLGGIPRQVPDGWWRSKTEVQPLSPMLLERLDGFEDVLERLNARRWNNELWPSSRDQYLHDLNDFFYSANRLAQQAPTAAKVASDLDWLFGTYRLGDPKR